MEQGSCEIVGRLDLLQRQMPVITGVVPVKMVRPASDRRNRAGNRVGFPGAICWLQRVAASGCATCCLHGRLCPSSATVKLCAGCVGPRLRFQSSRRAPPASANSTSPSAAATCAAPDRRNNPPAGPGPGYARYRSTFASYAGPPPAAVRSSASRIRHAVFVIMMPWIIYPF